MHRRLRQLSSVAGFYVDEEQPLADSVNGGPLATIGRPERTSHPFLKFSRDGEFADRFGKV
jgi:hypothetical protein